MRLLLRILASSIGIAPATLVASGTDRPIPIIKVDPDQVDFLSGSELVTRYHQGAEAAKPYFWPVHASGGLPVTRAWPMEKAPPGGSTDHIHQKSVWFCHGDVSREGLQPEHPSKEVAGTDFWSEGKVRGRIVCTSVGQARLEAGLARLPTHNEWRSASGARVLDEDRVITFYDFGEARLFVLDIDLQASAGRVTFGDTKEGSFGVRVNDLIRQSKGGKIENADGKVGEAACWGRLSAWCDYSGQIDGKPAGIAIFDDPANPSPACWHSRSYGLMAANPFGRAKSGFPAMKGRTDLVQIPNGGHLRFRYGLFLHRGDVREGKVGEYYQRFVQLREKPGERSSP
jgi:hypothetical protein